MKNYECHKKSHKSTKVEMKVQNIFYKNVYE